MIKKQKQQKNNSNQGEEKISSPFDFSPKLQRRCIACRGIFDREKLIRIMVENKTKEIVINPDNKTFGRSAYLCPNEECLKMALKKKSIERGLKIKPDENLFEKLKIMLN